MQEGTIFSLDLATVTGWAFGPAGGVPSSGIKRMGDPGCSVGRFLQVFEEWLNDMLTVYQPQIFAFEAPLLRTGAGGESNTSIDTARKLLCLAGNAERIALDHDIPEHLVCEADNSSVCKDFTGRGHFAGDRTAKKNLVMARCREMGWEPADDNAGDALALWRFMEKRFYPAARKEDFRLQRETPRSPSSYFRGK